MRTPNDYRLREYGGSGNNGVFDIPLSSRTKIRCITSDGEGWEHVSVIAYDSKKGARTPTWSEMNKVKDIFWYEDDTVMQLHPPKADYVNNHPHCLHLWKPIGIEIPRPPKILIGI